jgi:hypothetical protein
MKRVNGSWSEGARVQAHEPGGMSSAAALCALGDAAYFFYVDKNEHIRVAILRWEHVESNRPSIEDYGIADHRTKGCLSATVWKNQIYVTYCMMIPYGTPLVARYDVESRTLWIVHQVSGYCPSFDPSIGARDNELHLTFTG